jgi:hypothetical protein
VDVPFCWEYPQDRPVSIKCIPPQATLPSNSELECTIDVRGIKACLFDESIICNFDNALPLVVKLQGQVTFEIRRLIFEINGATIKISPTFINFGIVKAGATAVHLITITNTSNFLTEWSTLCMSSAFSVSPYEGILQPKGSQQLQIVSLSTTIYIQITF